MGKGVVTVIDKKLIDRINELAHKQKAEGLTPAEKEEQAKLRGIYLEAIRGQVKQQLDSIEFVDEDPDNPPIQ